MRAALEENDNVKGAPQQYMKLGIVAFMAMPEAARSPAAAVKAVERIAQDDDFGSIDVFPIRDGGARAEAVAIAREAELDVFLGLQGVLLENDYDLNADDDFKRGEAVEAVKAAAEEACEWGARAVVLLSGPTVPPARRDKAFRALVKSLVELTGFVKSIGAGRLILETFDSLPIGKNRLVGPTSMAVDIAGRVRDQAAEFGLLIDLSHLPLLGEDPMEAAKTSHYALEHVHVGNCVMRHPEHPAYGDNHPPFGIREGEVGAEQLARFLQGLLEVGYLAEGADHAVSFEVKPLPGQSPEAVIANAKETLAAAWALV